MIKRLDSLMLLALAGLLAFSAGHYAVGVFNAYQDAATKASNLVEPDPLYITSTDTSVQHIGCGGTVFLSRRIVTNKPLTVNVKRQFRSFADGHADTLYNLTDVTYREPVAVDKVVTYNIATPKYLPDGFYLYEPILTYQVNEHLTITKPAPSQLFYLQKEASCYEKN
jgi:hypothetical protein